MRIQNPGGQGRLAPDQIGGRNTAIDRGLLRWIKDNRNGRWGHATAWVLMSVPALPGSWARVRIDLSECFSLYISRITKIHEDTG